MSPVIERASAGLSWLGLEGRTVIVTGGASGIGARIVTSLVDAGVTVVSFDLADAGASAPGRHMWRVDITDADAVAAAVDRVHREVGPIDALVNNAGINRPQLLVDLHSDERRHEVAESTLDLLLDVNVKGPILVTQAVARSFKTARRGVIVNITSEAGAEGSRGQSVYAATKAALNALTLSWAKELAPLDVRVVGVAPAVLEPTGLRTETYNEALAYTRGVRVEDLGANYADAIPLGRAGRLQEVADVVCFLVSDRASYVTGTTVSVSGGKSRG